MIQKSYDDSASLYLIPTPIGNLDDITIRALNTLKTVDEVLCEDTRNTGILLKKYDINKKLTSCHEYNEDKMIDYVVSRLKNGYNLGLVTDQGSPIISDPGYVVARGVINAGYNVISLPGSTAFVPALSSSGIEPSPFLFYGFLNAKKSKQIEELNALKDYKYTFIIYEAVHRIKNTLENMLDVLGDRNICIGREISKIHEEYTRGKISEILPIVDSMKGIGNLTKNANMEFVLEQLSDISAEEYVDMIDNLFNVLGINQIVLKYLFKSLSKKYH